MRLMIKFLLAGLLPFQLIIPARAMTRPKYKAYKVEFSNFSYPLKLNNYEQVLITPPTSGMGPLIWANGTPVALPGFDNPSYDQYFVLDFNDSGFVCGDARFSSFSGSLTDPYFWTGSLNILDENPPGINNPPTPDPIGYAADINNFNDIIGQVPADSGWPRAVIWYGGSGKPNVIGTLDEYHESWGRAINNLGQVACDADEPVPDGIAFNRAFLWSNGTKTPLMPLDGQATSQTWALDINNSGWVVGRSGITDGTNSAIRATLWRNGAPVDLIGGPVTSGNTVATAINDSGMIILSSNGQDGRLWVDDSLWLINDLVVNALYDDGTPVPFVDAPLDINERGDIITHEGSLLIRVYEGTVVNSEGDAEDNDLNDGRCYTGGVNLLGDDECTLRAAIQQANASAGRDTIVFDIPVGGIPTISPASALPTISEAVDINGLTQPGAGMIQLSGSNAPSQTFSGNSATDGLTVAADSVEVRGMVINNFSGFGLNLQSGKHAAIESNIIGTDKIGATHEPNQGGGILISGADSANIGDDYAQSNTITYNGGPGISMTSGMGNTISRNIIHSNDGLGIDLGGDGVTVDDPLDADTGPNGLVNYPVIDSASISGGATRIYGHVYGAPLNAHKVEFFFNKECDSTGYGEGEQSMWTISTNTDASGIGDFTAIFSPQLPTDQFITMTATDQDGNTSEFSPCWPQKIFELVDGNSSAISNHTFALSRITTGRPTFQEMFIDSITTDADGRFDASDYIRNGQIHLGDTLKFNRLLKTSIRMPDSSFSVHLDNAKFDSLTYEMYYDTSRPAPVQRIVVDHSTFAFNLSVAINWDATVEYLDEMQASIRKIADYLYDVTDGQIRLDSVYIGDDALPALYFVDEFTLYRPTIVFTRNNEDYYLHHGLEYLPRRWFLPHSSFPDSSAADYPVTLTQPATYRFVAQRIMHAILGLQSEMTGPQSGCPYIADMGFMGWPFPVSGFENPGASEMSWSNNYSSSDCMKTLQWQINGKSCWDLVESKLEGNYDDIFAPIIKPDERYIAPGKNYFEGPNADSGNPDFDAASLVVFPNAVSTPTTSDRPLTVKALGGDPAAYTYVHTQVVAFNPVFGDVNTYVTQGRTDGSNGKIWLLGIAKGDSIKIDGQGNSVLSKLSKTSTQVATLNGFSWSYGAWKIDDPMPDSFDLTMTDVSGSYPLICGAALSNDALTLNLYAASSFQANPTLEYQSDVDTIAQTSFSQISGGYEAIVSGYDPYHQTLGIHAPDDLANEFFFYNDYIEMSFTDSLPVYAVDASADVNFILDSTTFITKAGVLSSPYPVIRSGLDSTFYAVSRTQALAVFPQQSSLPGDNQIVINYNLDNVPGQIRDNKLENSIRIFRWNESGLQWERVGGEVDTASAQVSTTITQPGVYAAFSTDYTTDADEPSGGNNLPSKFALGQNYPNPFNPMTTIEFELSHREHVTIDIFNVLGQKVRSLVDETKAAGTYKIEWNGLDNDGKPVSTGVYLYRLRAGDAVRTKKMMLIK